MQIIRSSKSLYKEAENLIRSVAKAARPVNPPSTHPIIQRIVWWYENLLSMGSARFDRPSGTTPILQGS